MQLQPFQRLWLSGSYFFVRTFSDQKLDVSSKSFLIYFLLALVLGPSPTAEAFVKFRKNSPTPLRDENSLSAIQWSKGQSISCTMLRQEIPFRTPVLNLNAPSQNLLSAAKDSSGHHQFYADATENTVQCR